VFCRGIPHRLNSTLAVLTYSVLGPWWHLCNSAFAPQQQNRRRPIPIRPLLSTNKWPCLSSSDRPLPNHLNVNRITPQSEPFHSEIFHCHYNRDIYPKPSPIPCTPIVAMYRYDRGSRMVKRHDRTRNRMWLKAGNWDGEQDRGTIRHQGRFGWNSRVAGRYWGAPSLVGDHISVKMLEGGEMSSKVGVAKVRVSLELSAWSDAVNE